MDVCLLTADQQEVYEYFCSMIHRNEGACHGMLFLDAPGGTGKTLII